MNYPHQMKVVNYPHRMQVDQRELPASCAELPPFHAENYLHRMGVHQAVHHALITIPLAHSRPHRFAARASELPITSDAEHGQ
jgi:hypothetical protein